MSRKATAAWRARQRAGLKPLKLLVDRECAIAMLEQHGALRPPANAYAGYEYSWAEVEEAAARFWQSLAIARPEGEV